ncbi:hypothetical protein EMIT0215P_40299 [Pseudomonas serboccidentalis]
MVRCNGPNAEWEFFPDAKKSVGIDYLWRGGLPPLGCEAAPKIFGTAKIFASAMHWNGGKPPRHKQAPSPQVTRSARGYRR